jgi:hypothetical protein
MIRAGLNRFLQAPVATGPMALACGIVAIALPTLVREAVNGVVHGCEFTPFLPSILVCAILLRWWQAGAVALSCVAIHGLVFEQGQMGSLESACFLSSAGIFLASSAAMIAVIVAIRQLVEAIRSERTEEPSGGIVFSLEQGEVWASWYGQGQPVRLGNQHKVSEMMEDFLAQVELGKRLNGTR